MAYVLFGAFILIVVMPMSATAGNAILALVGVALAVTTGVTMLSSRLVAEPASFFSALRANVLGFAVGGIALALLSQAARHTPFALFLGPIVAFMAGAWAISHVLSVRWPHATMICLLNGILLFGLSKAASSLLGAQAVT